MKTLLVNPALLHLEKIVPQDGRITIVLNTIGHPHGPKCGQPSTRLHRRYQRFVTGLPWEGIAVKLELHTRKFFCSNEDCVQRIYCERLPEVVRGFGKAVWALPNFRCSEKASTDCSGQDLSLTSLHLTSLSQHSHFQHD